MKQEFSLQPATMYDSKYEPVITVANGVWHLWLDDGLDDTATDSPTFTMRGNIEKAEFIKKLRMVANCLDTELQNERLNKSYNTSKFTKRF